MSHPTSPRRIAATLQAGGKSHQYFDLKALDANSGGKVRFVERNGLQSNKVSLTSVNTQFGKHSGTPIRF